MLSHRLLIHYIIKCMGSTACTVCCIKEAKLCVACVSKLKMTPSFLSLLIPPLLLFYSHLPPPTSSQLPPPPIRGPPITPALCSPLPSRSSHPDPAFLFWPALTMHLLSSSVRTSSFLSWSPVFTEAVVHKNKCQKLNITSFGEKSKRKPQQPK